MFKKIALIGAGNMGSILAENACKYFSDTQIAVCDKNEKNYQTIVSQYTHAVGTTSIPEAIADADIIILAIKPQQFDECAQDIRNVSKKNPTLVSIMAGVSTSYITEHTGCTNIMRTMPNTPMKYGQGVIGWFTTSHLDETIKMQLLNFFQTTGETIACTIEDDINKITAISGSGPAYFFYAVECLTKAATDLGFSKETAQIIAIKTFMGAATLLDKEPDPTNLREKVTSKGGTTEAALIYMNEQHLSDIWKNAVGEAYKRAQELSKK